MTTANPRSTARNNISKRRFSNNVPPGLHFLPPLNPKSEKFAELFRSFLLSKDERTNILALSEEDAKLFIEIIDRAFRAARLEPELRQLAFSVLRMLCGKTGHLPESYLLSDKFDLSGLPRASGRFADVRIGTLRGNDVAVKSLRVSEMDDKARIRKRFAGEVVTWKNLSHPNVLELIGVPDTLEDGRFSMVSVWMANGNIMEYVRDNAGNHLKLLGDAAEGLKYLHNANIIHGDLKGANILISNAKPVTACLASSEFLTILSDPSLEMESSESTAGGGSIHFMAPELLDPPRFGLDKCTFTKEGDIYAIAMTIYQVLTGTLPFGKLPWSGVVLKACGGGKPSKPVGAVGLGISDKVWKLLEDCWQTERTLRPSIKDVLSRVKAAASVCGIISSVEAVSRRYEEPEFNFTEFDQLFLGMTRSGELLSSVACLQEGEDFDTHREQISPSTGQVPSTRVTSIMMAEILTGQPLEAVHIVSFLKNKSRSKQLPNLERDWAQEYVDILDASLDEKTLCTRTRAQCLKYLGRLCDTFGILPSSFMLTDTFVLGDTSDGCGLMPFAQGGCGYVYQAAFRGRRVAVKTLFATNGVEDQRKMRRLIAREVIGWKWLQHENILPFVGVTPHLAIVSDFMENGNIMEFIANSPHHNRLHLLVGVASGLEYLHDSNIVHGDLKGVNVLIDSGHSARLADFGLTMIIDRTAGGTTGAGHGHGGTTRWMAPEMLHPQLFGFHDGCRGQLPSKSTDIYALGMTILEVLTRRHPFSGLKTAAAVVVKVMGGKPDRPLSGFSDGLWEILLKVWDPDHGSHPSKRPSVRTVMKQMKEDAEGWDQIVTGLLGNPESGGSEEVEITAPRSPNITALPEVSTPPSQGVQPAPNPCRAMGKPKRPYRPNRRVQESVRSLRMRNCK